MKYLKTFVSLLLFLSFAPVALAASPQEEFGWDYTNGWFDKNPGKFTAPANIYDNDLTTFTATGTNGSFEVKFLEPLTDGVLGFYVECKGTYGTYGVYNGTKKLYSNNICNEYVAIKIFEPIDRVKFSAHSYGGMSVFEFDLFDEANYPTVKNLTVSKKTFDEINIEWTKPEDSIGARVYFDGQLVGKLDDNIQSYKFDNLKADTNYNVSVSAVYKDGESITNDIRVRTDEVPKLPADFMKISHLKTTAATIDFFIDKLPSIPKFLKIYKDLKATESISVPIAGSGTVSKIISSLTPETEYTYYIAADYGNGNITTREPIDFKTLEPSKEVMSLTAESTSGDVSLTWKMPVYQDLSVARIYREKKDVGMLARMFRSATTYEPIFETNGTTFRDLTVKPATEYKYKVTTVDKYGNESPGTTITVKTKSVIVEGGKNDKNQNGDYVISWTSPVKGKLKVVVGGKEYKIVNAADKQITIPKGDMKYDFMGMPDVQLIPIDENGNVIGTPNKPGNGGSSLGGTNLGDMKFDPKSAIAAVAALLGLVGLIILLAMSFRVVPKLIQLLRKNF